MTNEQLEKIALLDKLFGALSIQQLREFAESEQVVARLKGTDQNPEIFKRLIQEHDIYSMDLMNAKSELMVLKTDFQSLMRVLNQTLFTPTFNQDFQNLKQKHSVY
jgi:hypothetical protein